MELIKSLQSVLTDSFEKTVYLPWWQVVLPVNGLCWLLDLGLSMKRKSRQETIAVMMLPGIVTFFVAILTTLMVAITTGPRLGDGNAFMELRVCVELLLLTVLFLALWILNMKLQRGGGGTWKKRILWMISYVPDILITGSILAVVMARLAGGVNPLAELRDTSAALGFSTYNVFAWLFCYAIVTLLIRLVLLLIALFARLISMRIPVGSYRENGHPVRRFVWYAAVCQNAYLRGVFAFFTFVLLVLSMAFVLEGVDSTEGAIMSVMFLLFFAVIDFGGIMVSLKPTVVNLRRFGKWGDRRALLEQFCREYFNEPPVLRTEHYTLTRHFLVDERSVVSVYYLEMLKGWKCWQVASETEREQQDKVYWSQPHTMSWDERSGWWWEISFLDGDTCFVEKEDVCADELIKGVSRYWETHQLGDRSVQQSAIRTRNGGKDGYDKLFGIVFQVVLIFMITAYFVCNLYFM